MVAREHQLRRDHGGAVGAGDVQHRAAHRDVVDVHAQPAVAARYLGGAALARDDQRRAVAGEVERRWHEREAEHRARGAEVGFDLERRGGAQLFAQRGIEFDRPAAGVAAPLQRAGLLAKAREHGGLPAGDALQLDPFGLGCVEPRGAIAGDGRRGAGERTHEAADALVVGLVARPGHRGALVGRAGDGREHEQFAAVAPRRQHRREAWIGEVELPAALTGGSQREPIARGTVGREPDVGGGGVELGFEQQVGAGGRGQSEQLGDAGQADAGLARQDGGERGERGEGAAGDVG